MSRMNEFEPPQREEKRQEYAELISAQSGLLAKTRETIDMLLDVIQDEVKFLKENPPENKTENNRAQNKSIIDISIINALTRLANSLAKIVPLELKLAAVDPVLLKDTYIDVPTEQEAEALDRYAQEWMDQRKAIKLEREAAAKDAEQTNESCLNTNGYFANPDIHNHNGNDHLENIVPENIAINY